MLKGLMLLVLGISLSGYIYLSSTHRFRFKLYKYQGHHLVYRVLWTGLVFFSIGSILFYIVLVNTNDNSYIFNQFLTVYPSLTPSSFNILCIGFNAIWLSCFCSWFDNRIDFKKTKKRQRITSDIVAKNNLIMSCRRSASNSDMIRHIIDAQSYSQQLLITMSDRKTYVCLVFDFMYENDESESEEISIIPFYSGYRDKDDLCLELTTPYPKTILAWEKSTAKETSDDEFDQAWKELTSYKISMRLSEVTSIATFDISQYEAFKQIENKRRDEIRVARKQKDSPSK